jgi:hypothetical protein
MTVKHRAMITGVVVAAMIVVFAVPALTNNTPSREDKLIEYLDRNAVSYNSRTDMLRLADAICESRDKAPLIASNFNMKDANFIQFGIESYCEGK